MLIKYFSIFLSGFLLSLFFISILKKISLNLRLLILKEMPLIGGVGIGLSFIFVSLSNFIFFQGLSKEALGIIICSAIMLVFGIIDDWHELSIRAKFLVQIIATGLLIFFGIRTQIIYIGTPANIIITFIWIIGMTNAFNHLDVMDGLASGSGLIISFAFFVISILNGDTSTALFSLTLAGAVFSLFLYNFPPAKVYMGNAGSHFLGFVLASIALIISYAPLERKIALLSPILILGLPIFDTSFLILVRIIKKSLPFKKSNDHLALRFLALGYPKKKALFVLLILCIFFCLCGIFVSQVSNFWAAVILVFVILVSLGLTIKMNSVALDG
jgi:UDP-GlcNAc:undecaprenyl-phosphate GlcNAc-1-phosphate transferase